MLHVAKTLSCESGPLSRPLLTHARDGRKVTEVMPWRGLSWKWGNLLIHAGRWGGKGHGLPALDSQLQGRFKTLWKRQEPAPGESMSWTPGQTTISL